MWGSGERQWTLMATSTVLYYIIISVTARLLFVAIWLGGQAQQVLEAMHSKCCSVHAHVSSV